ncbi:hypothetical protein I7I53_07833 [Histoplasma capsulatum var. duboisii H88]|uniref:Uncharacterized protein n=1 Tax=Ajellomyces capsulatus (strain H88) TaxID=544711 RepID=A0A8A1LCX3_AJEC8|nr:hypothetical protein I7I53_07833 [Histoplasma capsulatum var. duboisii H88]
MLLAWKRAGWRENRERQFVTSYSVLLRNYCYCGRAVFVKDQARSETKRRGMPNKATGSERTGAKIKRNQIVKIKKIKENKEKKMNE